MQADLRRLFSGEKVEAPTPVKRPVGRPKKVRDEDVPEPPGELRGKIQALRRPQDRDADEGEVETFEEAAASTSDEVGTVLLATPSPKRKWTREDLLQAGFKGKAWGALGGRPTKALRGQSLELERGEQDVVKKGQDVREGRELRTQRESNAC